jgi:hypothetical protein
LISGKVIVIRIGGGLGAFVTATTQRRLSWQAAWPGNSEAVWPSSPIPAGLTCWLNYVSLHIIKICSLCRFVNGFLTFSEASRLIGTR